MFRRTVFGRLGIAVALLSAVLMAGSATAADSKQPEVYSFGTLKAVPAETVRTQAQQWLVGAGKTDEATRKQFDAIWSQDRPVLDKVAATLSLDAAASKILTDVNNPALSVPKEVPEILKDRKQPEFFRATWPCCSRRRSPAAGYMKKPSKR